MMFKNRKGSKRKKKEKKCFVSWKAYLSSCYFLITPFPSHFKVDH